MTTGFAPSSTRRRAGCLFAAAALGAVAVVHHRQARAATARWPPHGRFVDVDGVRLHVVSHGPPDAPPVLLLHGNGSLARELEASGLVDDLARDHHVLLVDRPGYGHSTRPAGRLHTPVAQARRMLALVDALGLDRPVVLGHSWGALVALAMGLAAPDRLAALVLVSGYYTPTPRLDSLLLGVPAVPVVGTLVRHTVSPWLGRLSWPLMRARLFAPEPVTPTFEQDYPLDLALRPSQLFASAREALTMPWQALWLWPREKDLALPTVVVAGDRDRVASSRWQSGRLHRRAPGVTRLHLVPGAGHMVHHTHPEAVAEAVREAAVREVSPTATVTPGVRATRPDGLASAAT